MEPREPGGKPQKRFIHRTWIDGRWHYPRSRGPQADPFTSEWPAPRPLYRLPELTDRPDAPVLLVEGEGVANAAAALLPDHVTAAWCGGTGGINSVDWTPLAGRTVVLWPDADEAGRMAMAKLSTRLLGLGCAVSAFVPPPDTPAGWDLGNAAAEGWKPGQVRKLLERNLKAILPPEPEPEPEPPAAEPPGPSPAPDYPDPGDLPFTCLGFEGDAYYYQPHETGQVLRFTGKGHTSTALLQLAGENWWLSAYPSKTGVNWPTAFSMLFRRQAAVGVFDPSRVRGRGAWLDDGRCVLHLGDRLIIDGESFDVRWPPPTRFNYQRAASMDINTDLEPLTDQEGSQLIHVADQFHWETPASGLLIAGWIALAPICGALSWRPHVWLTAGSGSGKSTLLDRFLGPLLADLAIYPEGNTTEAWVRQTLRADARPVVFDEAESNEKPDQQRIQSVLSLARVASSSGRGVIGKGGASGEAQQFRIRSMFLLCSIVTALKHGADHSRFAQLTMRSPKYLPRQQRQAHWQALSADLDLITPELGQRLLLRSVRSIGVIRESVAAFRRAAGERLDSQRQGDQYGTLLAGAWSLMSQRPATHADALALIDANDWQAYLDSSEPDENRCLQQILQHQVRVETERLQLTGANVVSNAKVLTRTVWELVEAVRADAEACEVPADVAEAHLGRIGLRVQDERLLVSNTALGLQRILAETPWAHSWPTVLGRIPGAEKPGKVRFKGMSGNSRAVSLPLVGVEG
jgi:putative DNA primase/helicase